MLCQHFSTCQEPCLESIVENIKSMSSFLYRNVLCLLHFGVERIRNFSDDFLMFLLYTP